MVSQTSTSARFTCFVRILTFLAALISLTVPVGAQSVPQVAGMLDDGITHAPSATGYFDYNGFVPLVTQGANYADPVFGATVRRVTTDHSVDDIYARNMWWNADETKYLHRIENNGDYWEIIDVATGAVTHTGITGYGGMAANGGFDAADPNALYYYSGPSIHKVTLNASGTWSDSVYFTTPGNQTIGDLGGTINWMDASGRYMLVRYGSEPSVHLYDRQNLSAGPYANPISGGPYADTGSYLGLTPDGKFIVGYDSTPGMGVGMGAGVSWQIDHTNRSVAPAPNYYWDLCGDHGSFISASDGRNYRIGYDCYAQAGIWRIDITNSIGTPGAFMTEAQQQALPNNKRLLAFQTWNDFGHFATAAKGPLQDWGFTSTEDGSDTFNSGAADSSGNITPWHTYRQEIIGINVVTGEIRRLAHHRSRLGADYYDTPRVSVSWGGKWVGWSSNFDQSGIHDIYAVQFSMAADTISPTISITAPILGTIVSGATTVSANASDNVGVAGVQFKLDGVNLGAEVTVAPYAISWNTTLATNALHTLTATARDAAGNTATATTVAVTVSNSILDITPPVISAVVSANVSSTGATITWTTNEASDSQVDYGPTTSYGSSAALDTTKVTAHSQTLSGLAAGTLYHYRVKSRDAAGNLATSGDFTFTTATGSATPGFVGYWKFDDGSGVTAVDASGNGATGTLANKPNWVTGKLGYALSFNGSNQYVNVPNKSILNAYPITVAVWMKTTNTTGLKGIVNKYAAGSQNGYQVFMNGGNLCAWYFRNASNYVWDGSGCTLMTPGYNDNQWHQVVLVVDAGGGRMYVDGVLKASQGWTGTPGATSTTQNLSVGRYPGTASPYWPGIADDVRIYNYALDATAVSGLFAGIDNTPPTISAVVSANVSSTGATITWTTNEASDSQVDYGPTTSYGSSAALDTTKVTAHSQTLSGLAAGTLYHYRVKSRDAAGNLATSGDFTFTTATGSATPGFVGYWKFDDGSGVTAVDASGNGNSGTLFNGTAWTTGKFNGALSFDGVSGYVNVPHTAALDSYPLTVAAWIKTSATGLNGIVNKYYPGSMNGYQVFMNGGNLCAWYFKDAANYVWDGSGCTLMTPGYNDNQWHQVVLVVDAGGGRMYVDGVLKASQGWTGAPGATSSTQPLNIASYPATASPYLAGVLDDIRIYNYALSATEITNLYNAAATPTLENVAWINLVNVTATGNSLQKTAGCDGCEDAGATSQQQIASGDGYLEFTASEITALRYAGLSNGNPGTSAAEIKYAIRLQSDAEVNENGVYKASTTYMSGDLFRVSVESGVVKYYKNGVLFYTSTTAPSYPLLVDVAILNLNGTVTNAVISRVP